jgi:predicted alpha/beta superfamily hydrolase
MSTARWIKISAALALVLALGLAAWFWLGRAPDRPRLPSAGPGVHVIATPLAMPGLGRSRTLRIYLPPGYAASDKRYPVLYMHDGQNLFNDATSFVGEWGVDESLDAMARAGQLELIVVGIDHGGDRRVAELTPWPNPDQSAVAEGEQYLDFIVGTVKPWVDARYRTLGDRDHTGILGSSLGGLISDYAMRRHPEVFGRVGIFSPSYWYSDEVWTFAKAHPPHPGTRIWLVAGGREGGDMSEAAERMAALLRAQGGAGVRLQSAIRPQAEHNEQAWRAEFPRAVRFLFGP